MIVRPCKIGGIVLNESHSFVDVSSTPFARSRHSSVRENLTEGFRQDRDVLEMDKANS